VAVFAVLVPVVPAAFFPAPVQVVVVALVILASIGVGCVALVDAQLGVFDAVVGQSTSRMRL
jgi:hypothetical protein